MKEYADGDNGPSDVSGEDKVNQKTEAEVPGIGEASPVWSEKERSRVDPSRRKSPQPINMGSIYGFAAASNSPETA